MVPRRVTLPGRPVSKTTVASLEPVRYAAYYDQGGPIPLFHRAEAINSSCARATDSCTCEFAFGEARGGRVWSVVEVLFQTVSSY